MAVPIASQVTFEEFKFSFTGVKSGNFGGFSSLRRILIGCGLLSIIRLTLAMARRIAALWLIKVEVFGLVRFF